MLVATEVVFRYKLIYVYQTILILIGIRKLAKDVDVINMYRNSSLLNWPKDYLWFDECVYYSIVYFESLVLINLLFQSIKLILAQLLLALQKSSISLQIHMLRCQIEEMTIPEQILSALFIALEIICNEIKLIIYAYDLV